MEAQESSETLTLEHLSLLFGSFEWFGHCQKRLKPAMSAARSSDPERRLARITAPPVDHEVALNSLQKLGSSKKKLTNRSIGSSKLPQRKF
jgi:hypothetical protein